MHKYNLKDPIDKVNGIGNVYKSILNKLGIKTIEDLLLHIPSRYNDRSEISKISSLVVNQFATVKVEIQEIKNIFTKYRGMIITKAVVFDETGKIDAVWFNQKFIVKSIKKGDTVILHGKINPNGNKLNIASPEWELANGDDSVSIGIIPVYPLTDGISSKYIQKKIQDVIKNIEIPEIIPEIILEEHNLMGRHDSIINIHIPISQQIIEVAKYRLSFEELLLMHLHGIHTKSEWEKQKNSHKIEITQNQIDEFKSLMGFDLTKSQNAVILEILHDLKKEYPMNRLLQGDVGSGKTVVAEVAILAALESGFNVILMAPTQILAEQHFSKISKHLEKFGYEVLLLSGNSKANKIDSKKPYLIISTHAVLYDLDSFDNIGLIIIDEQHKFGVEQRTRIINHYTKNGLTPNLLTMTATPIPRSLALAFYGDLSLSVINEMPVGRKQTSTKVITEKDRIKAYTWIRSKIINEGDQVFIVCPFIEKSDIEELKDIKSAESEFERIEKIFPKLKVGLVHGKIKDKDFVINKFKEKKLDILVATPVIEVGIDIPDANIIVIENPERFGLASLHQLRGRVGRGGKQGYCILFASKDSSSVDRLKSLENIYNGAELAEIDMKIRGPGNIYGTEQHGYLNLKVADITDFELVKKTKDVAESIHRQIDLYPKISETIRSRLIVDKQ